MNYAASNGHLDVVKWLHANNYKDCTTEATDKASANGHLDVVKWLHQNRKEGCTTKAMNLAVICELFNGFICPDRFAMIDAARQGHAAVTRFMYKRPAQWTPWTLQQQLCSSTCMYGYVKNYAMSEEQDAGESHIRDSISFVKLW